MADEKKSPKPATATAVTDAQTAEHVTSLLVGLLLLGILASAIMNFINNLDLGGGSTLWEYFLEHIWPVWKIVAAILSVLALGGIIRNSWKLSTINMEEQKIFGNPKETPATVSSGEVTTELKNERWEKIVGYTHSNNASDWRLAIMEADVMLEELLRTLGYYGESIGEMLKSVDKNEFITLDDAWEAHKMRNTIAHSGTNFQLNEHMTKHTVALFERVFNEFGII